ncbi:T-complex protein 11 homolog isoform X3 [Cervus elaphus]|uniref:T-complex protein 11 homolog isoform X3 n=1 Tax=Cervus elaphus TaxID=9860 RepID=UPI001CC27D99|nr:T-complex protein 11 homolog isoform X3 [Cervus elaphus]
MPGRDGPGLEPSRTEGGSTCPAPLPRRRAGVCAQSPACATLTRAWGVSPGLALLPARCLSALHAAGPRRPSAVVRPALSGGPPPRRHPSGRGPGGEVRTQELSEPWREPGASASGGEGRPLWPQCPACGGSAHFSGSPSSGPFCPHPSLKLPAQLPQWGPRRAGPQTPPPPRQLERPLPRRPQRPRLLLHLDSISRMADVEENVPGKDPGDAESRPCKPESSGPTREDKGSLKDPPSRLRDTVNDVSKLSIEIGMNHDFHMEEKVLPPGSLEGRIKETMHNAFWDHLKEQLSATPPDFSCALELLKEIKEILLSLLLPRQNRLRSEIEEALDMGLLKQEAEHGALNVPHLSKYILNMMTLLCAPVRDEAVQKLENITDPVRLLRGIFQVLGLMKMDMVNYTIQSLQPQLQEHSVQYERAKFQDLLNKQPSLLDHTTRWLSRAAADLSAPLPSGPDTADAASSACSSPGEVANSPEPLSPTMVLSQGFLNLLLWDPEDDEFPETLLTDRARLQQLEAQVRQLTVLASVLLVSSSFSGSVLFGSPQFVDKLKRLTKALLEEFKCRSADPLVPQMLFGSWCAAVSAGPPWRPYPHRGRAGRTGPEVRQPHTPQSAGVRPLLHGDLKGPPAPGSGAGDRSGVSLMALAPGPGTLDPAEKPTISLG